MQRKGGIAVANFRLYYFSEALRMKVGVNVIIPENTWGHSLADRPEGYRYPVLWLQSGGGFDYSKPLLLYPLAAH